MSISKIKIKKTAQNLIGHFDPKAKYVVTKQEEIWRIEIESELSSLLIGRRGQNLQALEHILRLMVARASAEFAFLTLDISGYRAAREQEIAQLAKSSAETVLETGESVELPPMNSFERRLAHMAIAEIHGVETESVGEEPERKIIIKMTKPETRNPKKEIG